MTKSFQLYHFPFDPHSRLTRLVLGEKKVPFEEVLVKYWEPSDQLISMNPSGALPVLVENQGSEQSLSICENRAILEYLEEADLGPNLWPQDIGERAEARRLVGWFERKFDFEVNALLLFEKMEKRMFGRGAPDISALKAGREALRDHLRYFESLLDRRDYLAGRSLSNADFACAAHLSVIDYFDELNWPRFPHLKTWYMMIKSRPCFRPLLADVLPGVAPSAHYRDLDF